MSYGEDLLAQADSLCALDPRRPTQANLRRAISAAYYALFHQLTDAAGAQLMPGRRDDLRAQLRRKFQHKVMKTVAQATAKRDPSPSADLLFVADAFAILQEARHGADYDFWRSFAKAEATDHIRRARDALARLERVRNTAEGERFLLELLVGRLDG